MVNMRYEPSITKHKQKLTELLYPFFKKKFKEGKTLIHVNDIMLFLNEPKSPRSYTRRLLTVFSPFECKDIIITRVSKKYYKLSAKK